MSNSGRIPTNLRTLRILEIMGQSENPMTATEINQQLGLPKQTVHRLCTTLEKEGFLTRELNGKKLRASPRLKNLASGLLFNSRNQIAQRQVLVDIASKMSETVNLVLPQEEGMIYIDRVETDWPFRIQLPVGTHVPFHCTASGKTFLASMSASMRKKTVSTMKLERQTKNTHVEEAGLLNELDEIARRGYSLDNEELMDGMVAIAVPVYDKKKRYCAAIGVHGPVQRITLDSMIANKDFLIKGAKKLGETFFA